MKYVRTKDRVCKFKMELSTMPDLIAVKGEGIGGFVRREDIVKQADTIEELCDEFVIYKDFEGERVIDNIKNLKGIRQNFLDGYISDVKLTIWTDKGLIYVAKMNDKGELELL